MFLARECKLHCTTEFARLSSSGLRFVDSPATFHKKARKNTAFQGTVLKHCSLRHRKVADDI